MKKRIAMAFLLATLAATPVYAAEVQDFGTAGNVSVQQVPNGNGGSDDWIVVSPGESGRGVKIVDENGKAVVSVDRYGGVYVDGLGIGDVGNIVLRDRQNLAQNGIIVVVLTLEKYSGHLMAGPDLISRGFVYVRESEDLMEEARVAVQDVVDDCLCTHVSDWGKIKTQIKDGLSDFLWKKIKRNPVILPVIMEV